MSRKDRSLAGHGAGGKPGRSALVVEDEATIRKLTRGFLESMGFTVSEAQDGEEGLDHLRGAVHPFDLLVVDLVMPRLSGRQMIEMLRPDWPSVPILIMSGSPRADARDILEDPTIDFLAKPFRASAFREKVEALVGFQTAPGEAI